MKKLMLLLFSLIKMGMIAAGLLIIVSGCKKKDTIQPVVVNTFQGPTYPDNYTPISSWSDRSEWNLANVHDPTVEKCGEYYYMYGTDASYGNVVDGHGHFPYRRSKDLVNWEFIGTVFTDTPAWVKDSLNNKRARMNPALPAIQNPNYGYWAPYVRKVTLTYAGLSSTGRSVWAKKVL